MGFWLTELKYSQFNRCSIMNIQQAKDIGLDTYLQSIGHSPVKTRANGEQIYFSPLHEEKTPSFHVKLQTKEWYDFGLSVGGSIIDLVMRYHHLRSVREALQFLSKRHDIKPVKHMPNTTPPQVTRENKFRDVMYGKLSEKGLLSYLQVRCVDLDVAMKFCGEVHYKFYHKPYYGIAFANSSGGYEVRNAYFKGCIGKKDITILTHTRGEHQRHVCIFEGFMDFLSYMTLQKRGDVDICLVEPTDFIVLNSVSCLRACMEILDVYDYVHCYLDKDFAGISATNTIADKMCGGVYDESQRYEDYKDLNDYLRGKKAK